MFGVLVGPHGEKEGSNDEVGDECGSGVDKGLEASRILWSSLAVTAFWRFVGGSTFS